MDKKGYLTLSICLAKDGKVLLRKPEGIRDWFQDIKVRHTFSSTFTLLGVQAYMTTTTMLEFQCRLSHCT